jgi:AraC-like DNA-binding protein
MVLRPICEPVELPLGASVIAERVTISAEAPEIGRFIHFHDVAELVLFERVRGVFTADGRRHRLSDGSIVFVPSMRRHDYALERGSMKWLLVQIDPYIVERLALRDDLAPLGRPLCTSPGPGCSARVAMLGDWLLEAVDSSAPQAKVERIIELLLLAVAESPAGEALETLESSAQSERLLPALEHLRTTPEVPLSLEMAATLCSLSMTYFSRRFGQLFGMSFSEYSRIYRLHLAARRLVGSGSRISEIAFSVGFSNPAHFTARFRERFGMTPRAYRQGARAHRRAGEGN